jgi:hypothetical protein
MFLQLLKKVVNLKVFITFNACCDKYKYYIFSKEKKTKCYKKFCRETIPACVGSQSKKEPKKFKTPKQI